ncbi:MAG: hypothetical protein FWG65_11410 [Turicibacter sp.]|nr:hypothetical protein [Turicibacter sp.]
MTKFFTIISLGIFLPNIHLFFLYNSNNRVAGNFIPFTQTLAVAGVLAFLGLCLFVLFYKTTRTFEGTVLNSILFWLIFWSFENLYSVAVRYSAVINRVMLLILLLIVIALIAAFIGLYGKRLQDIPQISAVCLIIGILFFWNFLPAVFDSINTAQDSQENAIFQIQTNFNIDVQTESPDIYWIWMDGMLGFSAVYEFFGDPQNQLREDLNDRGFVINENATLDAGASVIAAPILFSPTFYDSYYSRVMREISPLLTRELRWPEHSRILQEDGVNIAAHHGPYMEIFHAFNQAGYTTIAITNSHVEAFTPAIVRKFYNARSPIFSLAVNEGIGGIPNFFSGSEDLFRLLAITTPLSILSLQIEGFLTTASDYDWVPVTEHTERIERLVEYSSRQNEETRRVLVGFADSVETPSPKFTFMSFIYAHSYLWSILSVEPPTNPLDPFQQNLYMNAHSMAARLMLGVVDFILEENPNAVIVLQADHGIHMIPNQQYLQENFDFTDEELFKLINSTMSAVRIPEIYGGLDRPLDPRNITRELVNRFVGQNYELLPQD